MPPACHTCGAVLSPASSASGLCPACLFAQVLSDDADVDAASDPESTELSPGSLFGPFRIEAVLGRGGMSTVYRARETALDRVVALKVLPPEFLHDETFARRFQQEARVVAALEHPHIVPLYASGIEGGIPWMSMRLMAGGSVADLVRAHGPLEPDRAVGILQAVAAALDYAHARGVVHRDVKPSNLLLDQDGRAHVGDFGLAHLMESSLALTKTGVIAGTPHYMAPEQGLGREVTHLADVYSLGVVAYEMLAGRPPFDADSPVAILMKHATEPAPLSPRDPVPDALIPAMRKALAKAPADRWPSATSFTHALEAGVFAPAPARAAMFWVSWSAVAGMTVLALSLFIIRQPVAPDGGDPPAVTSPPALEIIDRPVTEPELTLREPPEVESLPTTTNTPRPAETGPTAGRASVVAAPPRPPSGPPAPAQPVPPVTAAPPPSGEATPVLAAPAATVNLPDRPPVEPPPAQQPRPTSTAPTAAAPSIGGTDAGRASPPVSKPVVEETITQPVRIRTVEPAYPPLAIAAQLQGDVVLEAVIGPDGKVSGVEVVRPLHPLLDEAARAAVLRYGYEPGRRNGVPDTFRVQVTVSFRLE